MTDSTLMTQRREFLRWLVAGCCAAVPSVSSGEKHLVEGLTAADVADALFDELIAAPEDALDIFDFERVAAANLPPAHYGYVASGAGDSSTVQANRDSIAAIRLRLRRLIGVGEADISTTFFGETFDTPVFLCPVGGMGGMHPLGERAAATAARSRNVAMGLSTFASNAIEPVNELRGQPVWFQLYLMSTWAGTEQLVRRAENSGAKVMMITVDTPTRVVPELQRRYARLDDRDCLACHEDPNGPPQRKPMVVELGDLGPREMTGAMIDWDAIDRVREMSDMKIVIKGLETRDDAEIAHRRGIDGIYVSNHGGRGINASRGTMECLPEVIEGAGDVPVLVDGGFRRGTDVFKALAMGAKGVGIGRPYAWGMAAFGQAGVERVIDMFAVELRAAMIQAGARTLQDISRDMIVK
jgi:4-hydroxymandelate oxidase